MEKIKKGGVYIKIIPVPRNCKFNIILYYYEYNNKKAIIKANNPVASTKANPKIA